MLKAAVYHLFYSAACSNSDQLYNIPNMPELYDEEHQFNHGRVYLAAPRRRPSEPHGSPFGVSSDSPWKEHQNRGVRTAQKSFDAVTEFSLEADIRR